MFYIRTKLSEGTTITAPLTRSNVFTICPVCGKEHHVDPVEVVEDLSDFTADGSFDPFSADICCPECSKRRIEKVVFR